MNHFTAKTGFVPPGPGIPGYFEKKQQNPRINELVIQMGALKTQSPHTPQHRAHTARGTLKTPSPHTPQYRDHTQGNFVENLKASTPLFCSYFGVNVH